MASTLSETIAQLVNETINQALWGTESYDNRFHGFSIEDGRRRKKVMRQLIDGGYLEKRSDLPDGIYAITSKAFDEVPSVPVHLGDLWQTTRKEKDYLVWDNLSTSQKKSIIAALRVNPDSYTLLAVSDYRGTWVPFSLGGCLKAREEVSGNGNPWYAITAVTDASLVAAKNNFDRSKHRQDCLEQGINWYLHQINALPPEEKVPVLEKTPMFGHGPCIDRDLAKLSTSLPAAIAETNDEIISLRARLAVFQQVEMAVRDAGGYDAFVAAYEKAIDQYIDAKLNEPVTAEQDGDE